MMVEGTVAKSGGRGEGKCIFTAAFVLALCGGCNSKPHVAGKTVTGTVTYNGSPVEGASVSFISPTASGYGSTDKEGRFTLRSAQGEGVPVGEYKVTVVKTELPPTGKEATSDADYVPPDPDAPPAQPKDLLPAKYKLPESSQLSATVTEQGPNEVTLTLTD
ncbi:MAG TPA: carboxypeptidase-like regulatory domain-containing protein [Pirellulales bacterium]|nr:carboxypeptidase-like regulatory domain-containing protein [Pirellulales bacterium]